MRLQQVQTGEKIISYGEPGSDFYIILEGEVGIRVPRGKGKGVVNVQGGLDLEEMGRKTEAVILLPSAGIGEEEGEAEHELVEISRLGAGSSFGELSLLYGQPRAATIVSLTPTILAILSHSDFSRVLKASLSAALNDKVNFLHSLDAFAHWRQPQLIRLSYYCHLVKICRNHVLYREGDPADSVFMIIDGELTFTRLIKGQQVPVLLKGSKEMFGDREVVTSIPRLCTCTIASATASLYAISKAVSVQIGLCEESGEWRDDEEAEA
jgi:CRP-like cAMP-binding protein